MEIKAAVSQVLARIAGRLADGSIAADCERHFASVPDPAAALQCALYRRFFQGLGEESAPLAEVAREEPDFVAGLRAANGPDHSVDPGWEVESLGSGTARLRKDQARVELAWTELDGEVQAGRDVDVRRARWSIQAQPGYCYLFSEVACQLRPATTRIYWNIPSGGAAELVGHISGALNPRRVPFLLKCPSNPLGYGRRDAAVLYLSSIHVRAAAPSLAAAAAALAGWMLPRVPVFTLPLARGVALAENPTGPESFGFSRMGPLARAAQAHRAAWNHPADCARLLAEAMESAGISLARPYLNPASGPRFLVDQLRGFHLNPRRLSQYE